MAVASWSRKWRAEASRSAGNSHAPATPPRSIRALVAKFVPSMDPVLAPAGVPGSAQPASGGLTLTLWME